MHMRNTLTKSKKPSSGHAGCCTLLPPNKVAGLVRQLAEAQYEAEQLRQRMEQVEQENSSFRANISHQDCKKQVAINAQQQQRYEGEKQGEISGIGEKITNTSSSPTTTKINLRCSEEKPGCIERLLPSSSLSHSVQKARSSPPPQSLAPAQKDPSMALSPPLPSSAKKANELPGMNTQVAAIHVPMDEQYWKNKYMKLKHQHEKALMERDMQLAEVQQMVFQIHEEHDELRHRHERDRLQQQLEQEKRNRQQLESQTKVLQEEALAWRQRYLRFLETPSFSQMRVVAPDVGALLSDQNERIRHSEGLNQTDQSCLLLDTGLSSMMDAEMPLPQAVNVSFDNRGAGYLAEKKKCLLDKQGHGRHQLLVGTEGAVDSRGKRSGAVLHPASVVVGCRSIGVQAVPATVTGNSQTETRCLRSIAVQIDLNNDEGAGDGGLHCVPGDITALDNRTARMLQDANVENVRDGPLSHAVSPHTLERSLRPKFYTIDSHRTRKDGCITSPHLIFGHTAAMDSQPNASSRVISPPMASFSLLSDQAKRVRLEEDIRRHDQLLEAVSKLQLRVQRVAKTPSFQ